MVCKSSPKQGSVTSLSSTLPVPALHMQTVASPPVEALFAGQGAHIGSPGGEAGSMYSFTGQARWRRERPVSIYTHYNVLEAKCAVTTQFVGYTANIYNNILLYTACWHTVCCHIYHQLIVVNGNHSKFLQTVWPHLIQRVCSYTRCRYLYNSYSRWLYVLWLVHMTYKYKSCDFPVFSTW